MGEVTGAEIRRFIDDVRYMRDHREILGCIHRYGHGLDRLDSDLIASASYGDAVSNHGPFGGNLEEFVSRAIEAKSELLWKPYGITDHTCEINGDEAHVESYLHWVAKMREGGRLAALGGGRYIDQPERRNGQWKLCLRRLVVDYVFVVPADDCMVEDQTAVSGTRTGAIPPAYCH